MIKKLLGIILIVALGVLIYYTTFQGLETPFLNILSVEQISAKNADLEAQIADLSKLTASTYPGKVSELNGQIKTLLSEKQKYLDLANLSSDSEIKGATKQETYLIDYLWARIGNHATQEGVNLKMEKVPSGIDGLSNLNFTIKGSYVAIINFVSSIEKDSELSFRIENFKVELEPSTSASTSSAESSKLQGSFVVRNIAIQNENIADDAQTATAGDAKTNNNNPQS